MWHSCTRKFCEETTSPTNKPVPEKMENYIQKCSSWFARKLHTDAVSTTVVTWCTKRKNVRRSKERWRQQLCLDSLHEMYKCVCNCKVVYILIFQLRNYGWIKMKFRIKGPTLNVYFNICEYWLMVTRILHAPKFKFIKYLRNGSPYKNE
jgi:hypothetical protein